MTRECLKTVRLGIGFIKRPVTSLAAAATLMLAYTSCGGSNHAVLPEITKVTISATSLSLAAGETGKLRALAIPVGAPDKSVKWASSDERIVSCLGWAWVDDYSEVNIRANAAGTATITATTNAGGKTATCNVAVSAPVVGVALDKKSASVPLGGEVPLVATISPVGATNGNVAWTSSDPAVVGIAGGDLSVTAKALAVGTARITVATADGQKTDHCDITVTAPVVEVPAAVPNIASEGVWSFGVMGDTQWTTGGADNGRSPNTVAVEIMRRLNKEFIAKNVKFVIQVGDLVDTASTASLQTTSKYRQDLYNAGIGFFPLRGNHESSASSAADYVRVFPQTRTGAMNDVPQEVLDLETTAGTVDKVGTAFTVGTDFSSPNISGIDCAGLSYSFSYNNATFVLLDQFTPISGSYPGGDSGAINAQQPWISNVLYNRPYGTHAFVFSHKGLVHENHTDVLFGSNVSTNPGYQDNFIRVLADTGVKYHQSGHDHMHSRSIYTTTDGDKDTSVHHIVSSSNSSKFYTPVPSLDDKYNVPAFGVRRQTMLVQELYTIGYYVYTVNGQNVTVDYYSSQPVTTGADITSTPDTLTFTKKDSFGYNLGGRRFIIEQEAPYTTVRDGAARILGGANTFDMKDGAGRKCSHEVTTGWTPKTPGLYTDIFSIWGMANAFGGEKTDTYCLSLGYDPHAIGKDLAETGQVGVATRGQEIWVNAVGKNYGGAAQFVVGPYDPATHGLGTYGVDTIAHRFWAVVNYNADFAVAPGI